MNKVTREIFLSASLQADSIEKTQSIGFFA